MPLAVSRGASDPPGVAGVPAWIRSTGAGRPDRACVDGAGANLSADRSARQHQLGFWAWQPTPASVAAASLSGSGDDLLSGGGVCADALAVVATFHQDLSGGKLCAAVGPDARVA